MWGGRSSCRTSTRWSRGRSAAQRLAQALPVERLSGLRVEVQLGLDRRKQGDWPRHRAAAREPRRCYPFCADGPYRTMSPLPPRPLLARAVARSVVEVHRRLGSRPLLGWLVLAAVGVVFLPLSATLLVVVAVVAWKRRLDRCELPPRYALWPNDDGTHRVVDVRVYRQLGGSRGLAASVEGTR